MAMGANHGLNHDVVVKEMGGTLVIGWWGTYAITKADDRIIF